MKLELNFEDLENQWKERQIDLFPWLDGLFALLRSRDAIIRETEKKLSASTPATIVQFLSSDDRENAKVAKKIIKEQDTDTILTILLYSLEKVEKKNYPHRVMESLLDFDPVTSIGYLLGCLNLRKSLNDKIYQIFNEFFPLKNLFPTSKDETRFLDQIFQALTFDLKDRIPSSGKIETMKDFDELLRPDLEVMKLVFSKTWEEENAKFVENEMQRLGKEVIVSLHGLPFEFRYGAVLFEQLSEIIPYMALMRLKSDKSFLQQLPVKLKSFDLSPEAREEIIQKSEAVLTIIEQPESTIKSILDQFEVTLFII
jgi:hypothetical protein